MGFLWGLCPCGLQLFYRMPFPDSYFWRRYCYWLCDLVTTPAWGVIVTLPILTVISPMLFHSGSGDQEIEMIDSANNDKFKTNNKF